MNVKVIFVLDDDDDDPSTDAGVLFHLSCFLEDAMASMKLDTLEKDSVFKIIREEGD
jgi:hypothetical protein|tara:strand:- start:1428 stop:1598 length:171 start_codon:yes stop_codon:yes gene_type:complete